MIKDIIAITVLTWLIESLGRLLITTAKGIGKLILLPTNAVANLFKKKVTETGIVRKAIDGDSLIVETDSGQREVRIKGIDAPEYGQDGFTTAKRKVQSLSLGQEVTLSDLEIDKYGRTASNVIVNSNGKCLAQELAEDGSAYPDPRGTTKNIKNLSKKAKKKSLGVWKGNQMAPWEFRDMM